MGSAGDIYGNSLARFADLLIPWRYSPGGSKRRKTADDGGGAIVTPTRRPWTYSAPFPEDELEDQGEDMVAAATSFLNQIEEQTSAMRQGGGDDDVNLCLNIRAHHYAFSFPFDEELLPHWEQFAKALKLQRHTSKSLLELTLYNVQLPDVEVIDLLSEALRSVHFEVLCLCNNTLTRKGVDFALEYARNNPELEGLELEDLSDSDFDEGDVTRLSEIVKHHPSLYSLRVHGCDEDSHVEGNYLLRALMDAGAENLAVLALVDNAISTGGSTILYRSLRHNYTLQTLQLSGNDLDDNDAIMLSRVLKENPTLNDVALDDNNITKVGWTALYEALFDGTCPQSAADSNHTCHIQNLGEHLVGLEMITFNLYSRPKSRRQQKIFTVLSAGNRNGTNTKFLENVRVELLPALLTSVQRYCDYHTTYEDAPARCARDVPPLSIVYELMRCWEEVFPLYESTMRWWKNAIIEVKSLHTGLLTSLLAVLHQEMLRRKLLEQ